MERIVVERHLVFGHGSLNIGSEAPSAKRPMQPLVKIPYVDLGGYTPLELLFLLPAQRCRPGGRRQADLRRGVVSGQHAGHALDRPRLAPLAGKVGQSLSSRNRGDGRGAWPARRLYAQSSASNGAAPAAPGAATARRSCGACWTGLSPRWANTSSWRIRRDRPAIFFNVTWPGLSGILQAVAHGTVRGRDQPGADAPPRRRLCGRLGAGAHGSGANPCFAAVASVAPSLRDGARLRRRQGDAVHDADRGARHLRALRHRQRRRLRHRAHAKRPLRSARWRTAMSAPPTISNRI